MAGAPRQVITKSIESDGKAKLSFISKIHPIQNIIGVRWVIAKNIITE